MYLNGAEMNAYSPLQERVWLEVQKVPVLLAPFQGRECYLGWNFVIWTESKVGNNGVILAGNRFRRKETRMCWRLAFYLPEAASDN